MYRIERHYRWYHDNRDVSGLIIRGRYRTRNVKSICVQALKRADSLHLFSIFLLSFIGIRHTAVVPTSYPTYTMSSIFATMV